MEQFFELTDEIVEQGIMWGNAPLPPLPLFVATSSVQTGTVDFLWRNMIVRDGINTLAGEGGVNKSTLALTIAAELSQRDPPESTVFITGEDSHESVIRPRFLAMRGNPDYLHVHDASASQDAISLPGDADRIVREAREIAPSMIVVDPLNAFLSESVDAYRDHLVRRALLPLWDVTKELHAALLVLAHVTKGSEHDPFRRLAGAGLYNASRSVLMFGKTESDPTLRLLAHSKGNWGRLAESRLYRLEPILLPGQESEPDVETITLVDSGVTELDAFDLLGHTTDAESRSALDEAIHFLRVELEFGARPSSELVTEAAAQGIAERTLKRAKSLTCAKATKPGGVWHWSLVTKSPPETQEGQGDHTPGILGTLALKPAWLRNQGCQPEEKLAPLTSVTKLPERGSVEWIATASAGELEKWKREVLDN